MSTFGVKEGALWPGFKGEVWPVGGLALNSTLGPGPRHHVSEWSNGMDKVQERSQRTLEVK